MQALDTLLQTLATRWRLILIITLLTSVATTIAVYVRPPSYESDAALLVNVEHQGISASHADVRQDAAALQAVEAVTSHAEALRSRDLAERVVNKLDPKIFDRKPSLYLFVRLISRSINAIEDTGEDLLRAVKLMPPKNPHYEMIKRIENSLNVSTVRQAQVIQLYFRASNPDTARIVLQTLIDTYINLNAERALGTDLLSDKANRLRRQLEDAERELGELRSRYGIVDLNGEKSRLAERIDRLTTVLEDVSGAQDQDSVASTSEAQPGAKAPAPPRNMVERSVLDVPDNEGSGGVGSVLIGQLRSQLSRLRLERAGLREQYSPESAMVGPLNTRIANLEQQLKQEVSAIRETTAGYRARLEKLLKVEPQITQLSRNVSILSDTYEVYRKGSEDRLTMREQEAREQLWVIDPASIPYAPRGPLPIVLVLAGIGLGAVLGVGIALLVNFISQSRSRAISSARAEALSRG